MKETEHLGLSQWDPSDQILRDDFNADNAKIDAALGAAAAALPAKLGRMELVHLWKSDGSVVQNQYVAAYGTPRINWDDWEYFCLLIHFPNAELDAPGTGMVTFYGPDMNTYRSFNNLAAPGFLFVFLPQHNADAKMAGFLFNERFMPFSFDFTYRKFSDTGIGISKGPLTTPNVAWFGGK